ncbi:tetratricopeptide repeat protein, partial [Nocardiopsis tropica]|nr:tetratricopeptide repeat protein [Nocardiopsis tropica]
LHRAGRLGLDGGGGLPMTMIGLLAALFGTTAVLPWLVDRLFRRASGGPLSLQLAQRRLAAAGGGPTRAVGGIVVTVAGAIALQSLFANAWADASVTLADTAAEAYAENEFGPSRFQLQADLWRPPADDDPAGAVERVPGVEAAAAFRTVWGAIGDDTGVPVRIADCDVLRQMADLPACSPGDVFSALPGLEAGDTLMVRPREDATASPWVLPPVSGFEGELVEHPWSAVGHTARDVVLATPEAAAVPEEIAARSTIWIRADPAAPGMEVGLRHTVGSLDPTSRLDVPITTVVNPAMADIRDALVAGALACLTVIAAGLVVGTVEQVRERRRVHAVLTAFGARRSTLVASVVWQTTLPVLLGIVLACMAKDPDQRPTARQILDMLLTGRTTPPRLETPATLSEDDEDPRLRHAAEGGNTRAMNNLGILLQEQGEKDEAEDWYRRAAEGGNTRAMNNLGILLQGQGEKDEAEDWFRRAAEDGHPRAMNNLGYLLKGQGEKDEAEQWYRQAIAEDGNYTRAMNNLGNLLKERGETREAEAWYRRAAGAKA